MTKDNATGLKEEGGIEIETTECHSRAAPSLKYLPAATVIGTAPFFQKFKNLKLDERH